MRNFNRETCLNKNDWSHFYDVLLHLYNEQYTQTELESIFDTLSSDVQLECFKYGMADTCVRNEIIQDLKENTDTDGLY